MDVYYYTGLYRNKMRECGLAERLPAFEERFCSTEKAKQSVTRNGTRYKVQGISINTNIPGCREHVTGVRVNSSTNQIT